jgi:RNA polymerase sigma-70 factor (ECF subfamily)
MPKEKQEEPQLLKTQNISEKDSEKLVREHISWMLALARRMLGDHALAEDAVQDAFINAFRALDSFEGRSSLKTWLHRITVNACLTKMRQSRPRAEQVIDEYLPEFDQYNCRIEAPWDHLTSVDDILENDQLRDLVRTKIFELPEQYRNVLLLRDIEGYDTGEVALLLDISVSNVKVRLHRARSALKKLLEPLLRGEIL